MYDHESLIEFSFPQGCKQVSIKLKNHSFQDEAIVELLNDDRVSLDCSYYDHEK